MAKPNVNMVGRTAGSPDNAQGTLLLPDQRHAEPISCASAAAGRRRSGSIAALLLERAGQAKVKLLDHRIDVPGGKRDFPAYLDSNRFLSNLPGTTDAVSRSSTCRVSTSTA